MKTPAERDARKAELESNFKSSGKSTVEEKAEWFMLRNIEICDQVDHLLKENRGPEALLFMVQEMVNFEMAQATMLEMLANRVADLEAANRETQIPKLIDTLLSRVDRLEAAFREN